MVVAFDFMLIFDQDMLYCLDAVQNDPNGPKYTS